MFIGAKLRSTQVFMQCYDDSLLCPQYLKTVRHLEGYSEIMFPHCGCDSRRDGHVMAIIGLEAFKLQACKEDGVVEVSPG